MSLKATNNVETNKYELEIEISAEDFEAAIEKAYLKARKNIAMPGFRKGKAPRKLIEKEYGEQVFFEDAVNLLYAPVVNGAVEESGLELVTRPEVEVTEISKENGVKLKATCITKPEVEVKDYKGIEVEKVVNPVTDEDINKQLDALREKNVTVETVDDRAAENGDDVVIDFEGFKDDVAFEGGKAEDFTLSLGSGQFIPGFEDQIVGHTPGETFDVTVTFPEGYSDSTDSEGNTVVLSGKKAVFSVTLNYISEKVLPELTDAWVAENYGESDDVHTVEELKALYQKMLYNTNLQNAIMDDLLANSTFKELPKEVTDYQVNQCLNYYYTMANYYGYDLDSFVQTAAGYENADDLLEGMSDSITTYSKEALLYQAVAETLDIVPTQEQIDTYSSYTDTYGENYCTMVALMDAVTDALTESAVVS